MIFQTPYMSKNKHDHKGICCKDDEILVEQSHKDKCEINNIIASYQKTGIITHQKNHADEYGFATPYDFQASMELITKAQSMFDSLPSSLRNRFDNDPAKYLEFVQNKDNLEEMYELGMAIRPEKPQKAPSTPQPQGEPQEPPEKPSKTE